MRIATTSLLLISMHTKKEWQRGVLGRVQGKCWQCLQKFANWAAACTIKCLTKPLLAIRADMASGVPEPTLILTTCVQAHNHCWNNLHHPATALAHHQPQACGVLSVQIQATSMYNLPADQSCTMLPMHANKGPATPSMADAAAEFAHHCMRAGLALQAVSHLCSEPAQDMSVLCGCRSRDYQLLCYPALINSNPLSLAQWVLTMPLCASSPLRCNSAAGGQGLRNPVDGLCSS